MAVARAAAKVRSLPIVQYGLLASQPRPRWRARTNSPVVLASSLPSAHRRPRVKARSPGWPGSSRSRTSACPCRSSDRTEGAHRARCLRPWLRKPAKLRIEDSAAADTHSTRAKRGPGESPGRCWAPRPGRLRTHNGPVRATANARKAICRAALNRQVGARSPPRLGRCPCGTGGAVQRGDQGVFFRCFFFTRALQGRGAASSRGRSRRVTWPGGIGAG